MLNISEDKWKEKLSPEQYSVLRGKGTESPFTGSLLYNKENGMYVCGACGAQIFDSKTKFDSGSGWPSFYDVAKEGVVITKEDGAYGMNRTEVLCANCGSHLGHLFNDAPDQPTGLRYCINSAALDFKSNPEKENKAK